jgi:hypothetical protein
MIASDWVGGLVVVGDQRSLVGLADLPVPPDAGGQGQQPLGDPDPDPGQGPATMLLQPELTLEGLEHALDPLPKAPQRTNPVRLISPVGTQQHRAVGGDHLVELTAGEPLVGQDDQSRAQPAAFVVQQGGHDLALAQLGVARHQATGRPSGPARTYSRKPQK